MARTEAARACRVCAARLGPFMTFGRMPIANGFLTADQIPGEFFYELAPAICGGCGTFQLIEQPPRARLFHADYAFATSSSLRMQTHFAELARVVQETIGSATDPFVVEIGSNDGCLLRHIKDAQLRHIGVEPAANVAAQSRDRGVNTVSAFFDEALAAQLRAEHGPATAIVAANVICHIADVHGLAAGIAHLLAPDGVLIFEDPYLGDMITNTSYDQIYDEHVFMLSAAAVTRMFAPHGLELIDVMPQDVHGGSMRYVLARHARRAVSPAVGRLMVQERVQGLNQPATYDRFRERCERSRDALRALLAGLRAQGKRVAGYAATSKSTTVTNYCGLGPNHIEFISDTTPIKQGKLSPGMHIPIKPREEFARRFPDFAVLFAWNHAAEIFSNEPAFKSAGGKWISFVPHVAVLD